MPSRSRPRCKSYRAWRDAQTVLANEGVVENERDYQRIMWIIALVMLVVLAVIVMSWVAMQRVLLKPLHEVMGHIRHIATGDLTHNINADGKMRWRCWRKTCRRCSSRW